MIALEIVTLYNCPAHGWHAEADVSEVWTPEHGVDPEKKVCPLDETMHLMRVQAVAIAQS